MKRSFLLALLSITSIFSSLGSKTTIDDFSRLNATVVTAIRKPKNLQEFKAILEEARSLKIPVSMAGQQHSQGGHTFAPNALVIDIRAFNKILNLDVKKKVIRVRTGCTWEQIQKYIDRHDLAIKVMQTPHIFTIGGSLSVNAHGSDPHRGPLIETIQSFRILLATGEVVNASRSENSELFYLAIGGYGLFGIILDVDIELTDNEIYQQTCTVIPMRDYPTYLEKEIINNQTVGLHFGRVSLPPSDIFDQIIAVTFKKTNKKPGRKYPIKSYEFFGDPRHISTNFFRHYKVAKIPLWPAQIVRESIPWVCSRNTFMQHPIKMLAYNSKKDTDVLQSYFVPAQEFPRFIEFLRELIKKENINVLFNVVRPLKKENESFLRYAHNDYIEIVLHLNHGRSAKAIEHTRKWTQQLINCAVSMGGNYYLPTRQYATAQQFKKAYPMITEFFVKKKFYDPEELFSNMFYCHYKDLLD